MFSANLSLVVSVIALLVGAGGITYASIRLGDVDSANSNLASKVNSISNDVTSLKSQIGQLGQQQAERLKAVEAELAERKASEALIDAARKEGKVVFYTTQTVDQMEALKKRFESKYSGLTFEYVRLVGGVYVERLKTEFASGVRVADAVNAPIDQMSFFKKEGWLQRHDSAEVKAVPDIYKDPAGLFTGFTNPLYIAGYNTKLVSTADAPKSWEDFVDLKWKGKFSIADPFIHTSTLIWFDAMKQVLKDKWPNFVKQMRALNPLLQVSLTPVAKAIATGEASVGLTLTSSMFPELARGSPIAPAVFGPLIALPVPIAVLKDAPHPNAAKILINWLLSEDTMEFLAGFGDPTSRGNSPPAYSSLVPLVKYTARDLSDDDRKALTQELGLPWK